jgi:16S rRNA (guanine527-N7)-methyltransferase
VHEGLDTREEALVRRWVAGMSDEEGAMRREALALYLGLLRRWNGVYGLVGPNESARLVERHVLPSLALADRLGARASLLDVGSGAGFPGLVVALFNPERRVVLVERNGKKARFLEHAARRLGLGRLRVVHDDVRRYHDAPFDAITARAWGRAHELVAASAHLAHESSVWYLLKGRAGQAEIAALPPQWRADFTPLLPDAPGGTEDFLLTVVRSKAPLPTGRPV